jgi:hypothetical protein
LWAYLLKTGYAVAQLVGALCYKPEGRGFEWIGVELVSRVKLNDHKNIYIAMSYLAVQRKQFIST